MITVFVDRGTTPSWYARVTSYRDLWHEPAKPLNLAEIDAICAAVRAWLQSVAPAASDGP